MPFQNRQQAARLLVKKLENYRGKAPLILAIPRGAVPMGAILAEALEGELDVVLVRKLGAPQNPEFALGAVDESGHVYLNPYAREVMLPVDYLEREKEKQLEILHERRQSYTPQRPPLSPQDRIVVVVDDGIATGSTMIAALQLLRSQNPRELIVATAVAPPSAIQQLRRYADQVICLETPEDFYAVGQFFEDFSPVEDDEVEKILQGN